MKPKFKVEGFQDLERALMDLPKVTAKASVRRVLKKAAQPIADAGAGNAPVEVGDLRESYGVGTKLTKRQQSVSAKESEVEVYAGPGKHGHASGLQTEFGNEHQAAQPHLRPAWDANRMGALDSIKDDLWADVQRSIARYRKRLAKKGSKR